MNEERKQQLLEKYILRTISKSEKQELLKAAKANPSLQQELALEKALKKMGQDSQAVQLKEKLGGFRTQHTADGSIDLMVEKYGPNPSSTGKKMAWFLGGLIGLGIILFWLYRPSNEPQQEQNNQKIEIDTNFVNSEPIAAAFQPLDFLEEEIKQERGLLHQDFNIKYPTSNAVFTSENGQIKFYLKGEAKVTRRIEEDGFNVLLYSNNETAFINGDFLLEKPLKLEELENSDYRFDFTYSIQLVPGQYYFIIALASNRTHIYTGRFRVM